MVSLFCSCERLCYLPTCWLGQAKVQSLSYVFRLFTSEPLC